MNRRTFGDREVFVRLLNTLGASAEGLRGSYRLDDAHSTATRVRICRFEQIEQRH